MDIFSFVFNKCKSVLSVPQLKFGSKVQLFVSHKNHTFLEKETCSNVFSAHFLVIR